MEKQKERSHQKSQSLFERAERLIVGGVNSPVRAFRAVGGSPPFIASAQGCTLTDADGNQYIDYVGSWGPAIVGHAHPKVVERVREAALSGLSFGAPTPLEVTFAEAVVKRYPSIELLRCVSSGTEATMSALRVARGFTGRAVIVKFDGAYHGHSDSLLVKAGSGAATFGAPDSAGVPEDLVRNTATLAYNDTAALEALFAEQGQRIAAVIVEPVAGNMGCVAPEPGFLEAIVRLCREHGALSIFDEVMTGSRLSVSGAQGRYQLRPDLTCLGKVVGGGMPLAVYGGRRDVMSRIAPLGPVYQAGTLSGNPLAVSAGLATLELLDEAAYARLETLGARLESGVRRAIAGCSRPVCVQRVGSMITIFFHSGPIRSWNDAKSADTQAFGRFHRALLGEGVYWPPAQFEAAFLSLAHDESAVDRTIEAITTALARA
ncbi:MAG TPA: glutamate-1-semialdehyde 2,1-aminomutase [Polyangiaceae bacterium]|nr:glutamate-1-semialdehyde 2,1-aminomutase [Polyangiaceae bacterium]